MRGRTDLVTPHSPHGEVVAFGVWVQRPDERLLTSDTELQRSDNPSEDGVIVCKLTARDAQALAFGTRAVRSIALCRDALE